MAKKVKMPVLPPDDFADDVYHYQWIKSVGEVLEPGYEVEMEVSPWFLVSYPHGEL